MDPIITALLLGGLVANRGAFLVSDQDIERAEDLAGRIWSRAQAKQKAAQEAFHAEYQAQMSQAADLLKAQASENPPAPAVSDSTASTNVPPSA